MARIIAFSNCTEDKNRGEWIVYRALEKYLPNHFLVLYDYGLLRTHADGGNYVDGQADFIILDQLRGVLMVAEVKEGYLEHRPENGNAHWYQNGRKMDTSPWAQAKGNKWTLVEWLSNKLAINPDHFPLSHGHVVLLPDVHTPVETPMPDVTADIAITWDTGHDLAGRIEHASDTWQMKGHREPDDQQIEEIRKLLIPSFVFGNTLQDRIGVERREAIERADHTSQLIEFISNRRQALIAGCAGSGKTTLAVAKALELAAGGKSVLMLVYNEGIAGYLAKQVEGQPLVEVKSLRDFCHWACARAGMIYPEEGAQRDAQTWWSELAEVLDRALTKTPADYDALIVDEAQDFQFTVWIALKNAIKPDGWYYIFYDREQNIYGGDLEFPIAGPPFLLLRNARSTQAIIRTINERAGTDIQPTPGLPEGAPVIIQSAPTKAQRRKLLGKILHDWIRKEGLTENQIVILGAHSLPNTSMETNEKAGSYKIIERGTPGPGIIPYYTYMAFKGCEADAIILIDVDGNDPRWSKKGFYTAITRARHLIGIVEHV